MDEDGLTPEYTLVEAIHKVITIPVNVMIRPHNLHFNYTDKTFEQMIKTVKNMLQLGAKGFVFGSLVEDYINKLQLETILEVLPSKMTFHRAIDTIADPVSAYMQLINYQNVSQILTSGGLGRAVDHLDILDQMYQLSPEHLLIGSGVNAGNVALLNTRFPLANLHIGSGARVNNRFDEGIDCEKVKKIRRSII